MPDKNIKAQKYHLESSCLHVQYFYFYYELCIKAKGSIFTEHTYIIRTRCDGSDLSGSEYHETYH